MEDAHKLSATPCTSLRLFRLHGCVLHAAEIDLRSLIGAHTYMRLYTNTIGWLVGCFGFNGPLRQYFSLYWAVSRREGERGERINESKNLQTTPTRTYCKRNRPLPYCNKNCRTPRHYKLTQHHRTTRPSPKYHWTMSAQSELSKQSTICADNHVVISESRKSRLRSLVR